MLRWEILSRSMSRKEIQQLPSLVATGEGPGIGASSNTCNLGLACSIRACNRARKIVCRLIDSSTSTSTKTRGLSHRCWGVLLNPESNNDTPMLMGGSCRIRVNRAYCTSIVWEPDGQIMVVPPAASAGILTRSWLSMRRRFGTPLRRR